MKPFFLILKALLVDYSHHNYSFDVTHVLFLHYSRTGICQNAIHLFYNVKDNKNQFHSTLSRNYYNTEHLIKVMNIHFLSL